MEHIVAGFLCLYFCIQLIRNEWFWMFLYVVTLCENDCYVESDWLAGNQDNVSELGRHVYPWTVVSVS
jgi:hypothetical protein